MAISGDPFLELGRTQRFHFTAIYMPIFVRHQSIPTNPHFFKLQFKLSQHLKTEIGLNRFKSW